MAILLCSSRGFSATQQPNGVYSPSCAWAVSSLRVTDGDNGFGARKITVTNVTDHAVEVELSYYYDDPRPPHNPRYNHTWPTLKPGESATALFPMGAISAHWYAVVADSRSIFNSADRWSGYNDCGRAMIALIDDLAQTACTAIHASLNTCAGTHQ